MSKNAKKPGADTPSDPRNKNLNTQNLVNKGKARRMPPPATLTTVPKKESSSETPQMPNKQWGSTGTPNTPEKPDWSQVTTSLPYQTPRSRTSVSNAEFPSLSGGREAERSVPPLRDAVPPRAAERPLRKPQEGASGQRPFNPSFDGPKYQQQRYEGQSESRNQGGGQRQSGYYNQRSNQTNSRNNPYPNRQGQPDRNRSGYNRQHPSYDREKAVPEMFADSGSSYPPHAHSLPIKHANFESDMDAKGWAGKQDNVDYSEKIKFDSSGDEADPDRVKLRRIPPPSGSTDRVPNKSLADPPPHRERAGMQQQPEYAPEPLHPSGASMQSPVRPGKPTQIMKRPTSETPDQTPVEPPLPERPAELRAHSPYQEPPPQPQKKSMRQTVPTIPAQPAKLPEPQTQTKNTSASVPEPKVREVPWRQDKPLAAPKAPSNPPAKGSEAPPPKEPANVWERRKQTEQGEQQRQGLQDFPKLGDNDPVKSCVIIPTKVAEKQGPRPQDDDVFAPDKGSFHPRQGSWDRRDRERRRSEEKRSYGRQGSRSGKFGNDSDKSQNWRTEGGETEDRGRFGDRGKPDPEEREDRSEDRFRKGDTSERGRREDRGSSRGYQRREYPDRDWEERGGRFQGRPDERGGDSWRGDRSSFREDRPYRENDRGQFRDSDKRQFNDTDRGQFRDNDKGQFRDNDKGQFRDNDKGQFRDNDKGQFRENDRRQFRDNDKRQFRDNDRGQFRDSDRRQFRDNDRRQFRDDDRGQFRNNEMGRFRDNDKGRFRNDDKGRFRDEDRGDKYGRKPSSEGRTSAPWGRPAPSANNSSYASAVTNRGDTEEDEVSPGQEGEQPRPSDGDRRRSGSQDSWRQREGHTGHMTYTQQRKLQPTRPDAPESESRSDPASEQPDAPIRDAATEWTDLKEDPRREEGETASASPSDAGFIEIRKNRNKGRGMSSAEVEVPRSLGRGRGRIQEDSGVPGSRSTGPPGKSSATTDSRFSRGGSPQKPQGLGRARIPERTNHVSPKRNFQRGADPDKKSGQHSRVDSPPPQISQKLSSSASSASSNYVQPGLSFSAIASKNIEKTAPPPPPQTPTKSSAQSAEEKEPTGSSDETAGSKESETARRKQSLSKVKSADSQSPDRSPDLADEQSDKEERLSDENDEVQEVVSTTIVNSFMKEEVDEIDKTPHAHLIAHGGLKEEPEALLNAGEADGLDWSAPSQDRTPTPQKQMEKSAETASTRQAPVPSKLEERPRSNTPIQATQPAPAPIPVAEHRKSDAKPAPLPTTSNVFPDASPQAMLNPGFTSEWFNTATMPSLGDMPSHLPFQYPIPQHSMTDDDKAVRSKQSDLADYVNAPEFQPASSTTLPPYPDSLYPASLASANFINPNYPPDFSQQTLIQSLQPSLDAATTAGGLLTAPRINPGTYPSSQFSLASVYPPSQIIPGNMAASQLRPAPHQNMMRQFTPHPIHTSPNLNAFAGYSLAGGNMRAAVMGPEKPRRNDKMSGMGDKVSNPHNMYYKRWDANNQYNNGGIRKNTPVPFTPLVQQNIRNYNPNHRSTFRPPKKSNPASNSGYLKSYAQPTMGIPPSIHSPQYRGNQSFISVVGPVRAQQQPQHVAQLRNPNNQYRGKSMQMNMNYYTPRQIPATNMYFLPQGNRGPQSGPHITSGITPSIESGMPPQGINYQVQTEGDMSKGNLVGPQFNMQIQEQIPGSQKFRSFPSEHNGEDSVASEYSKIGPVAVNGRSNNDLSDKMHPENTIFVPQVPNLLSSDPLQQGGPSDLIIKSQVDVSSASPPSVMDIYGPEPLVTSSTLASSSSEALAQSYQSEEKLPLPPSESPQDDQTQPQVNMES